MLRKNCVNATGGLANEFAPKGAGKGSPRRSSACADETGFCNSSAQADDRRGLPLPAPLGANSFASLPVGLRQFFRNIHQPAAARTATTLSPDSADVLEVPGSGSK